MHSTLDLDQNRKRFFFTFFTVIVLLVFPLLMAINYTEHDRYEMTIDLLVIAVMAGSYLIIRLAKLDLLVFRANHGLLSVILLHSVSIGAGEGSALYWAFAIPPLYFYFFGKKEGLLWASFLFAGVWYVMVWPPIFKGFSYNQMTMIRFLITLFIVTVLAYGLESARYTFGQLLDANTQELLAEKNRLENALNEIKTLRGFIPICSNCKKIRDDSGYWEQVEIYLQHHSDANFSHSICPECIDKLYPEISAQLKNKKRPDSDTR